MQVQSSFADRDQMDSCVRCLRQGVEGAADCGSAVVLLLDEVEGCAGGDAVLEQVCIQVQPVAGGVCQAAQELETNLEPPLLPFCCCSW